MKSTTIYYADNNDELEIAIDYTLIYNASTSDTSLWKNVSTYLKDKISDRFNDNIRENIIKNIYNYQSTIPIYKLQNINQLFNNVVRGNELPIYKWSGQFKFISELTYPLTELIKDVTDEKIKDTSSLFTIVLDASQNITINKPSEKTYTPVFLIKTDD